MGYNPYLEQFLMFYSQSEAGNGLTRGLENDLARRTYVPTKLDQELLVAILDGRYRLVILTGNAGDGKTAFIQKLEEAAEQRSAQLQRTDSLGSRFTLSARRFKTLYDGSVELAGTSNLEMLEGFFADFRGADPPTDNACAVVAVNEGKLIAFLSQSTKFPWLSNMLLAHLQLGAPLPDQVVVVNLNLRAVTDASPTQTSCLLDCILDRFVAEEFWTPCDRCSARHRCPVKFNVDTFRFRSLAGLDERDTEEVSRHNDSARVARSRLKSIFQMLHFRKRVHVTVRDLRSVLAFVLFGKHTCQQIEAAISAGTADFTDRYYYNAVFNRTERDRILELLREFDVGDASSPMIDSELSFLHPRTAEFRGRFLDFQNHRQPDLGRSPIDLEDLTKRFEARPRSPEERTPDALAQARSYVLSLRRKLFFEGDFPSAKDGYPPQRPFIDELVPYDNITEFMSFIGTGVDPSGHLKREIILAISRSESIYDEVRGRENVCIRTRHDADSRVRAFFTYPAAQFALDREAPPRAAQYVEFVPSALVLRHKDRAIGLEISLDLYEMLMRIRDGYVPAAGEMRAFFLNLLMFKKQLMSTPSERLLLTENDYALYELARTPENGLAVSAIS